MSTPRSGLKPPSRISKPGGILRPGSLTSQTVKVEDAVAQSARAVGMKPSEANQYADNLVKVVPSSNSSNSSTPKDDFIIGERVIVSGNKRGYIQFLGETKFAPGQWAGVVLDDAVGKNDGSVGGVRYFQCEPKRGVFARPDKLSRESATGSAKLASAVAGQGASRPTGLPSAPRMGTRVASPRGSVTKLPPSAIKTSGMVEETTGDNTGLKGGDRVMVSGTKLGTLRYIGTTEFAKGDWAGVELDEELGKNDGAVAGTRYFQCQPKHGLFAPIHKVAKVRGKPPPRPSNSDLVTREKRSSSTSSLSSMGSTASGIARNTGLPPLDSNSPRSQDVSRRSGSAAHQAEKRNGFGFKADNAHMHGHAAEEMPNESSVVATVMQSLHQAAPVPSRPRENDSGHGKEALESTHQAEHELAAVRNQYEQYMKDSEENLDSLKSLVESADKEKVELLQQLEEERRKLEDLQFRLEEANINSTDLKAEQQEESARVRTLKERLVEENQRASKLQQEVDTLQVNFEEKDFKIAELEAESATYQEQIDFLQKEKQNALELVAKQEYNKLVQKQQEGMLTKRDLEIAEMQERIASMNKDKKVQEEELAQMKEQIQERLTKQQQSASTIEALEKQLSEQESSYKNLVSSVKELKNTCADLERKYKASEDRCNQLVQDKQKLEADIAHMMKSSGDSSEQLVLLNEQLRTKERRVEELLAELSDANQSVAKLKDTLNQSTEASGKETKMAAERHQQEMDRYRLEINSLQANVAASDSKVTQLLETHKAEVDALTATHVKVLSEVKGQLEKQKEVTEKLRSEEESLRCSLKEVEHRVEKLTTEKSQTESTLEQTSKEKDKLREELDQTLAEKQQLLLAKAELTLRHDETSGKYKQLQEQLDKEGFSATEQQLALQDANSSLEKITQERDTALRERTEALAQAQEAQMKLDSKETEVEMVKQDGEKKYQEQLQRNAEMAKETDEGLKELRSKLETAVHSLEEITSEKSRLESEQAQLQKQLDDSHAQENNLKQQTSKELEVLRISLDKLTKEKEALSQEKQAALQEKEVLLQEQDVIKKEKETALQESQRAVLERETLLKEKDAISEEKSSITKEKETILELKASAERQAQEAEVQRVALQAEVEGLRRQVDVYKQQLETVKQATEEGQSNMGSLQAQLAEARCEADARQHKADQLLAESTRLKEELADLTKAREAKQELEADFAKATKELQELRERLEAESLGYEAERDSVQNTLDVTNSLVIEKEKEVEQQNLEISSLKGELTLLGSYKSSVERLEEEKVSLEDQNKDLRFALQQAEQQALQAAQTTRDVDVDGDPILDKLQEEREMAEGQVTFLNSVIVDLQRKNDELRARVEIMEEGGMNGAHNDMSLDDMDLELTNRMPPPRLFCDICDVFDLHDTEDCPLQSSSDSPPPTQYHGSRHEERAYCDICEVFGHWTENCDDEQTY